MSRPTRAALLVLAALAVPLASVPSAAVPGDAAGTARPLPTVSPTPQHMARVGPDVPLAPRVELVVGSGTDAAASREVVDALRAHGVRQVDTRSRASGAARLTVLVGPAARPDIARALRGTDVPQRAEGYALRAAHRTVALGGADTAGQFYAAKTLRGLLTRGAVAGAEVSDHPSMPLRGSIEGFYGPPWTESERLDQMDFLGDTKANTYVYAPKDDPYHREKWRDPYPAAKLDELGTLVDRAIANHVRFTFAVSPGGSICYSDAADVKALTAKLQSLYDLGVRSFSLPLDDISYTKWNCAGDQAAYGAPGQRAAAKAQVGLLNAVQKDFIGTHDGARPLQMVPTEYGDLKESPYKKTLREELDKGVEVMWTGTDVVPVEITNSQAEQADRLFGRKVFVWDNYPCNDFGRSAGRLLLAPYDKRDPGLSDHLSGIVSNPMNQEGASKPAQFTMNDFSWNDRGYDRARSGRQAAAYLAGGDARVARAVETFVDLNHVAPTFHEANWQPQSPVLSARLDTFWKTYATDPEAALRVLRPVVRDLEEVPGVLREGLPDRQFLHDADRWLDATGLWGGALSHGVAALTALDEGDEAGAARERERMNALARQAGELTVDPAEHHQRGTIKLADPFLGDFVAGVNGRVPEGS
ncbi:beta-N-acetylhexosaminidase family protein [Streptomyces lasiicapitis]|uniref:beta-N-acetylhexosaminidase family protein n=1 Tax=Streptomyces lasiicapitis TaxID=1923961 RepID=UPI00365F10E3